MTRETACVRGCCVSSKIPLDVKKNDVNMTMAIAEGGSSKVMRGRFGGKNVAVKMPSLPKSEDLNRFHSELQMMLEVDHPNIATLVGVNASPPDYFFVMELCKCNLAQAIHEQGWRPDWRTIVQVSADITAGLAYLHEMGIVHRDVKPANVLLCDDGTAKVTDLGIATSVAEVSQTQKDGRGVFRNRGKPTGGFHKAHMVGTLEYMAPEVLSRMPHSTASDCFAAAVTINEIATATVPYSDCTKDNPACHTVLEMGYGRLELAQAVAGDGLRPIPAHETPSSLLALLDDCWLPDKEARPSMAEIHARLRQVASDVDELPAHASTSLHMMGGSSQGSAVAAAAAAARPIVFGAPAWGPPVRGVPVEPRIGAFATAGRRGEDKMEDRHLVVRGLASVPEASLVAVFDGHRGAEAAEYCKANLVRHLSEAWGAPRLEDALSDSFVRADAAFCALQEAQRRHAASMGLKEGQHPGSTALAAVLWGCKLVLANAGDCRALLCTRGRLTPLTTDHTAECARERERITAAGGDLVKKDTWRVGKAAIQVTRSIGDADLKESGLTAVPEITVHNLSIDDEYVVIACDGLWDTLSEEQVGAIIKDTVKHPGMVSQRLVTEAITAGSGDNVTCIVVFLQAWVGTLERVY